MTNQSTASSGSEAMRKNENRRGMGGRHSTVWFGINPGVAVEVADPGDAPQEVGDQDQAEHDASEAQGSGVQAQVGGSRVTRRGRFDSRAVRNLSLARPAGQTEFGAAFAYQAEPAEATVAGSSTMAFRLLTRDRISYNLSESHGPQGASEPLRARPPGAGDRQHRLPVRGSRVGRRARRDAPAARAEIG